MLRTLGIDLAAQDRDTAVCLIQWPADGSAEVLWVEAARVCTDDALVAWMGQADEVGIDAPMGWPSALVDLLPDYMATGRWPVAPQFADGRVWYDELRLRETDRAVHRLLLAERDVSVRPLSVSSDTIAVVAFRCARLLALHGEHSGVAFDRTGHTSRVFEVYPAAALASWGFPHKGYKARARAKRAAAEQRRRDILSAIERQGRAWLNLDHTPDVRQALIASDHALDAFLSALAARAAGQRWTTQPKPAQQRLAEAEGWIHVPRPESFESLAGQRWDPATVTPRT